MEDYNLPKPEFYDERGSFRVIFRNDFSDNKYNNENEQETFIEKNKNKVLEFCVVPKSAKEIRNYLNIQSRRYVSINILQPLISEGKLSYTNMNNIKDKNQKYITVNK